MGGLYDIRRSRGLGGLWEPRSRGREPVARFVLDEHIDTGVEPPGQRAARFGNAELFRFPAHV